MDTTFSLTGVSVSENGGGHSGIDARDFSDRGARKHVAGDLDGARAEYAASLELEPNNTDSP